MNIKPIIKRDGRTKPFDRNRIEAAVLAAFNDVDGEISEYAKEKAKHIADYVEEKAKEKQLSVEEIQDYVECGLSSTKRKDVAKAYILYREERNRARGNLTDATVLEVIDGTNEYWNTENSNKNPKIASTQRDYMAGVVSSDITRRMLLPKDIMEAHDSGVIHFHDADYFIQHIFNCCLVNMEDILQNGTVINGTAIEKPHSFATACNIATQVMAVVASGQYGGQSVSLAHLAPFIDVSRQKIKEELIEEKTPEDRIEEVTELRLRREVKKGVQTMQYQINTLSTTNGQSPFVTLFMYLNEAKDEQTKTDLAMLIEEVLNQRYEGVKNEKGVYVSPTFPKLVYVLQEDNIRFGAPYWYLTQLAAKCSAKRLVPDYVSEKVMKRCKVDENGNGHCYPPMGCRSFLTPYVGEDGQPKYYGRFNMGVCTINLIDAACAAADLEDFWKIFDERLELCHKALRLRYERLKGTTSDVSPIHFQYGAIARLKKGETIDKLLENNYATISLGYAGLWECVYKLIGKKLTEEEGQELGIKIMQKMNDKCSQWRAAENISYSLYGTPIESTTYKFAKCLKQKYGIIPHVTDKLYITNSYHVHVTEPVDAFTKLSIESKFQELSPGGAISYIEVPNMQNNLEAVEQIIQFMYDNIMYAEINTKSDYCEECGFDGEIKVIQDENGEYVWECPNCGNRNQDTMSVVRRTCGYLGGHFWNRGRTAEIADRVVHCS
jgi:ribonucleoside-triphosphate reductase